MTSGELLSGARPWVGHVSCAVAEVGMANRMLRMETKKRRGFTLIEILVVVAIIALLVAILLPALARARAHARHKVCLSNLRELGKVMYQYAIANGDYLPRACNDGDRTNWTVESARVLGLLKKMPAGFTVNDLQVHRMEVLQCPERTSLGGRPFLGYVVNAVDPKGPRLSGLPNAQSGTWEQVAHFDPTTAHLAKMTVYNQPVNVAYLLDAASETENISWLGVATMREAREDYYMYLETGNYGKGAIGVMDVWKGGHMPQGKNGLNTDDRPGPRRAARKLHLNHSTNAAFMDGHAAGVPLADYPTAEENYAYWLRIFGVKDAERIAVEDGDLK